MEAWMAFVSIIAIVAIVVVAGGIIAFIGHVIIGVFDKDNTELQNKKEVLDYAQYKQLQDMKTNIAENNEYNFEAINKAKVEQEKKLAAKDEHVEFELDKDSDLEDIEKRLAKQTTEEKVVAPETAEADDDDLSDLDDLLSEISADVIEEEKETISEQNSPKMSDELSKYSIDKILEEDDEEDVEEEFEEIPQDEVVEEEPDVVVEEEPVVELEEEEEELEIESLTKELENISHLLEGFKVKEQLRLSDAVEEEVKPIEDRSKEIAAANAEIESLRAQLAELNKKLEETQAAPKVEVVTISMTEEECLNRIQILEERLKNVKKDYKINLKEYKPLKKVMTDLERYQTKLRRKETIVAKKKVALYGVNNYVDIDKEKAEKLANELELYEGLRLSVAHCEEVINANKDRFPILEHTNEILEEQIAHIEADLAAAHATLQKIREQNGDSGNGENSGNSEKE